MTGLPPGWGSKAIPGDAISALGIDPGPTTGMLAAWWHPETYELLWCLAFECTDRAAPGMTRMLLEYRGAPPVQRAQAERFIITPGGKGTRLRGVSPARIQDEVAELAGILRPYMPVRLETASRMKAWAEKGSRLARAGLAPFCEKFGDIPDAAGHAMFTAVHDGFLPDPCSTRAAAMNSGAGGMPG